jgi:hypothetical protein
MNVNPRLSQSLYWLAIMVFLSACNTTDDFGSGLVADQFQDINFDEIITLQGSTKSTPSVITFQPDTRAVDSSYVVGNYIDPVFGKVESIVYAGMRFRGSTNISQFTNVVCDSIKLQLRIAPSLTYGDTNMVFNLNVHQLDQVFMIDSVFNSNIYPSFNPMPIGKIEQFQLKPRTRVRTSDTTSVAPYIEIPIDNSFGQQLLDTEFAFDSISRFINQFRGIAIKVDENTPSPLFGVNLLPRGTVPGLTDSRIILYYSATDTTGFINISLVADAPRASSYRHDYSQSPIAGIVDQEGADDRFLFLQGLSGVRPHLTMPDLSSFKGKSVKLALLEMVIAESFPNDGNLSTYPRIQQALAASKSNSGNRRVLEDITRFQSGGLALIATQFGGNIVPANINGQSVEIYRMNVTQYINDYINGKRPEILEIFPNGSDRRPERVILHGPGHEQFPVRLKLIFTE